MAKTLEDIPGVGPAIAEKLQEAGYTDLMAIAVAAPADLAEKCEIGEKKAISADSRPERTSSRDANRSRS